jgi:two-component system, cell cycle sensor histidine kinase and response regulator CckA
MEGKGSTFYVYIPATDERPQQIDLAAKITAPKGTECILLIEDEELVVTVTRRILERQGYSVLTALNGAIAVDLVRSYEGEIHLAILDMGMPVMNGAEAFPLLREARPNLKILICSGYEKDSTLQNMLDNGACAFVRKPYRWQTLAQEIRRALDS